MKSYLLFSLLFLTTAYYYMPVRARPTGAPVCSMTRDLMSKRMGYTELDSPNGWSLVVPEKYEIGKNLEVTVKHPSADKRYRGILIWASDSNGNPVGKFKLVSHHKHPLDTCENALTHKSPRPKKPETFKLRIDDTSVKGTVVVEAFVVEDCGEDLCVNYCKFLKINNQLKQKQNKTKTKTNNPQTYLALKLSFIN